MSFNGRSRTYLLGYAGVVLATILAVIGLGTPGWLRYSVQDVQWWFGLWQWCTLASEEFHCEFFDYSDLDEYTKITQATACIGVAFLVLSTLYGLCVNMLSANLPSSPFLQAAAFTGGMFLLFACVFWVGYKHKYLAPFKSLGYAMILATTASVLALPASICVLVGSRRSVVYKMMPKMT